MELVYLWVEKYKNIHKQGFNFSPRFNCDYNPDTNELTIDENDDYIENFFGDNINVTAIVGKNGSGKSSVLELIIDFSDGFSKEYKVFYLLKIEDKLYRYCNNLPSNNLSCNIEIIEKSFDRTPSNAGHERDKLNYAYLSLSPFLNNINRLYRGMSKKNYLASIYNYIDDYENKTFNYTDFYLRMIPKIPNLLKKESIQKLFTIQGNPEYLRVEFNKSIEEELREEFNDIDSIAEKIDDSEKTFIYAISLDNQKAIKKVEKLNRSIESRKHEKEKEKKLLEEKLHKDESKNRIVSQSHNTTIQESMYNPLDSEIYNPYGKSGTDDIVSKFNTANSIRINNTRKKILKVNLEIEYLGTIKLDLLQNKRSQELFYFSSGELVLLFYIEKLVYLAEQQENILLLIDENELFLHPDWQKKFLLLLIELFGNSSYKKQIIVSTHSPFLISDIPKNNIIFLKNGRVDNGTKHYQTFGANIHTLLSDSFFMEDGLMGEFAKGKIDEIIDFFNNKNEIYKDDKKKLKNIIEAIGEPFLKDKLLRMHDEKYPQTDEEKIKALEAQIKSIKNGQD